MNKSIIQFMLAMNKQQIHYLEDNIFRYRQYKTYADANGFLDDEYEAHEALKYLRAEMKKYVSSQKLLKSMMKNKDNIV